MKKLSDSIKEKAKDNKISCKVALELAKELNISPSEIGNEINNLKIKIAGCQLGCFK